MRPSTSGRTDCTTAPASSKASAAYDTPKRQRRVPAHRAHRAARRTRRACSTWSCRTRVDELEDRDLGPARRQRACRVLPPADRLLRLRPARRLDARQPGRRRDHAWPWGAYLGEDALRNGIRAKISSWQRVGPNVIPHVAKATGVYLNSMLASIEANRAGYDEAILLTHDGYIADGSGENIFVVKRRRDLHARPLDVDPAGHHARHGHPDRAGSRPPRRREAADPHRSLPRRRGVHGAARRRR